MPDRPRLVEVGPRDGLQSVAAPIPTDVKVQYVDALSACGVDEIEVSSFVSPAAVPQLADAAEVFARIRRAPGVLYSALVPNEKGLDRALAAGADRVSVFTAASESFTQRNIGTTIAGSFARFAPVVARGAVPVRGYVSTAVHCPFEGPVAPAAVRPVAERLLELGCVEVSIGDTIGRATPDDIARLLDELLPALPTDRLALHLHDTFGHALANARVGWERGIRTFDGSAGGIGGCPFAPGAPGNVATEALARTLPGAVADADALARAGAIVRPWVAGGRR